MSPLYESCDCCGGALDTGGCRRCSSPVTLCAGCLAVLSCGCGRTASGHRCHALVPVKFTLTTPEGSATIDLGHVPVYYRTP